MRCVHPDMTEPRDVRNLASTVRATHTRLIEKKNICADFFFLFCLKGSVFIVGPLLFFSLHHPSGLVVVDRYLNSIRKS